MNANAMIHLWLLTINPFVDELAGGVIATILILSLYYTIRYLLRKEVHL